MAINTSILTFVHFKFYLTFSFSWKFFFLLSWNVHSTSLEFTFDSVMKDSNLINFDQFDKFIELEYNANWGNWARGEQPHQNRKLSNFHLACFELDRDFVKMLAKLSKSLFHLNWTPTWDRVIFTRKSYSAHLQKKWSLQGPKNWWKKAHTREFVMDKIVYRMELTDDKWIHPTAHRHVCSHFDFLAIFAEWMSASIRYLWQHITTSESAPAACTIVHRRPKTCNECKIIIIKRNVFIFGCPTCELKAFKFIYICCFQHLCFIWHIIMVFPCDLDDRMPNILTVQSIRCIKFHLENGIK